MLPANFKFNFNFSFNILSAALRVVMYAHLLVSLIGCQ